MTINNEVDFIERWKAALETCRELRKRDRAEIERLQQDVNVLHADICAENDNLTAENERLRKEIERLLVIEQQLWELQARSKKHKPGPDDYPPGWVTGETP